MIDSTSRPIPIGIRPRAGGSTRCPLSAERQRGYSAAKARWIVDTLTRQVRNAPPAHRGFAYVLGMVRGEPRIFAYTLMPTIWSDTYSAEYDTASFSRTLAGVLDGSGLLPATFTKSKRSRGVVTILVADRSGNEIFNSGTESPAPVSRLALPDQFGGALALEPHPTEPRHIATVRKIGYRFVR